MRIGVIPENLIEWAANALGYVPRPLLETIHPMFLSRAIMAGVRLGVFEYLAANGPRTPEEIAVDLRLHDGAVGFLARALQARGYLRAAEGRFGNTALTERFLLRGSRSSVADFVDFNYDQWEIWSGIEDTIRTGEQLDLYAMLAGGQPPDRDAPGLRRFREYAQAAGGRDVVLERSTRGLRDLARLQEDELHLRLWLPGSIRSLLDVAGGHGGYSVAFCRRYPQLTATVIELAETVKIGRKIVEEEGLSDRVRFVEGDATTVPLGGPHDVAFFFNLAHHLSEEENRAMFRRIAEVLRPGGAIVVMEMFADLPTADRFMVAAFGLYFQRTSGARTHTSRTVAGWLEAAGYERVWTRTLRSSGGVSGIVVGRRAAH